MRYLVTGANGFVGKRLVSLLKERGHNVLTPSRSALDVAENRFPDVKVDSVVHLASLTSVRDSWNRPLEYLRVNAEGTYHVAEFCRRSGASLVFASSYCYGVADALPISESSPLKPGNPYALSKVVAEEYCRFFARSVNLEVVILRPFNIYGVGQDASFLVPHVVREVLERDEIVVDDLEPRRDYVHVADVVRAIADASHGKSGTYNVGSGISHSVGEVIALAQAAAGTNKRVISKALKRKNEIPDTVADISAIKRDIGWRPSISLAEGIAELVAKARR